MSKRINTAAFAFLFVVLLVVFVFPEPIIAEPAISGKVAKGKRPIIIIPGIMGSELKDERNGETVWFSILKGRNEDLRLPVALNLRLSTDKLVPGDIIREIDLKLFPDIDIYKGLIERLVKKGGYKEAKWEDPPKDLEGKFFVFPYDWRRDNVETAQFLIEEIEEVKRLTGRKDVKFNVLAHSMGGLVARYAAMYGMADLSRGRPKPTWAGRKHFANLFFFGTPNEGSAGALQTLLRGRSVLGPIKLPFVRYLSPVDVATMPAVFQLLPHSRTARFYDENLKPIKVDLYNIRNWKKYGWAIYSDEKYLEEFSEAEAARFERYFDLVLRRAKKFHRALDIPSYRSNSIGMHLIGSDCRKTLDALVLYKNENGRWITLTKPSSFKNSKGRKIESRELRSLMLIPGDGSVTRRSLLAEMLKKRSKKKVLFGSSSRTTTLFVCEDHERIMSNTKIQKSVLAALVSERQGMARRK